MIMLLATFRCTVPQTCTENKNSDPKFTRLPPKLPKLSAVCIFGVLMQDFLFKLD